MAYDNNHYVPQFILRRFGDKLNRYNVKTGDIKNKGSIINAFSGKNIYPEWLEHMLSDLESRIANLIDNKILNVSNKVTITRTDNLEFKPGVLGIIRNSEDNKRRANTQTNEELNPGTLDIDKHTKKMTKKERKTKYPLLG